MNFLEKQNEPIRRWICRVVHYLIALEWRKISDELVEEARKLKPYHINTTKMRRKREREERFISVKVQFT